MAINDVVVTQQSGGIGRRLASTDGVCGLLFNIEASIVGGLQINTAYRLNSLSDLNALLIDEAYDTANDVLVYEQIKDFYRVNPAGELWIMAVGNTLKYAEMVAQKTLDLVTGSGGRVKLVGYSYNTGIDDLPATPVDLELVLAAAQSVATDSTNNHSPISTLIECVGYTLASVVDWRSKNSRRVSMVAGQNFAIAQTANDIHKLRCAIGLALGTASLAAVHENIGWVQKFNLFGGNLSKGSVAGVEYKNLTQAQINSMHEKGLIFIREHADYAGLYWNDSHTSIVSTDDFSQLESNRTIDKATRLIRRAFLPYLNSPVYVNPTTGALDANVVKMLEAVGSKTITDEMLVSGEISGFTFTLDPYQDILATSQLEAILEITPVGVARKILIKVGFSNPFNS